MRNCESLSHDILFFSCGNYKMIFCIYFEQFYVVIVVTDHIALRTHFYSQLAINDFSVGRILRDDAIPFFDQKLQAMLHNMKQLG